MDKLEELFYMSVSIMVGGISFLVLAAIFVLVYSLAISGIIYFIKEKMKRRKKSKFDKRKDRPGSFSYDDRYEGLTDEDQ